MKEPGAFESPLKIEKQAEYRYQESTDFTSKRKSVESMTASNYLFKDSDSEGEKEICLRIPSKSKPVEVPKVEECSPFESQTVKQPSQLQGRPVAPNSKSKNKPPKISALKFR